MTAIALIQFDIFSCPFDAQSDWIYQSVNWSSYPRAVTMARHSTIAAAPCLMMLLRRPAADPCVSNCARRGSLIFGFPVTIVTRAYLDFAAWLWAALLSLLNGTRTRPYSPDMYRWWWWSVLWPLLSLLPLLPLLLLLMHLLWFGFGVSFPLKLYDRLEFSTIARNDCIWMAVLAAAGPHVFAYGGHPPLRRPMLAKQDSRAALDLLCGYEPDVTVAAVDDFLRGMPIHAIHLNVVSLYKPDCSLIGIPMAAENKFALEKKIIKFKQY